MSSIFLNQRHKLISKYKCQQQNLEIPYSYLHICILSAISFIALQNAYSCVNVICNGSPSLIRIVRLISFGITTLPRSSILLTIPVAFILILLYILCEFSLLSWLTPIALKAADKHGRRTYSPCFCKIIIYLNYENIREI